MKLRLTLAFVLPALGGFAQNLTNDGASIVVQPGAFLYVAGTVQNNATSTLTNAGTVQLAGDLTNAGTLTSSGTLLFTGTTNQTFTPGTAAVTALTLNNTGGSSQRTLVISNDLTISGQLTLLNGLVRTAPLSATAPLATLTLPAGAGVTGEAVGRYVQGNLRVLRNAVNAGTGPVDFTNGAVLDPLGQDLGAVTITRTAGLQTAGLSHGAGLSPKGIDRVWQVESSQATQPTPATPAAATLSWVSDDDNGFNPAVNAQLWRAATAAGPWAKQGAAASAGSRSLTATFSQLGVLTVSNMSAPLPVELTRFTAEPQGDDALLQWATASEKNNDHFDIEASVDGRQFSRIAQVAGHGSTSQPQQYQLVDKAIARYAADLVYYRLRQVDADGTATYSPIRTVRVSGLAGFAAQLYPNPLRNSETLTLLVRTAEAGPLSWQLTDALGRNILSQKAIVPAGASMLPLAAPGLATGVYLLRVQQGSHHQSLKLVCE